MNRIKVKKGQILQSSGERNTKAYTVESGLLRSYSIDEHGKEHIFMFAPEGWIISDAHLSDEDSLLFIDALEDSEIVVLEKSLSIQPLFAKKLIRRMSVIQKRILMLMSSSAIERYDHFIKTYPDITQRVPQKMIASYLGITPEALSRVKKESVDRK